MNFATGEDAANALVAEIRSSGGKAVAIQADFSKRTDIQRLFEESKRAFGALDVLVNNAGVYAFAPLQDSTEQEFHREFTTNVLGRDHGDQGGDEVLRPNGGSIIQRQLIASVGYMPNSVIYAASKSAVDAVTRVTSIELAPRKIRVNTLAPERRSPKASRHLVGRRKRSMPSSPRFRSAARGTPADIARGRAVPGFRRVGWVTGERITASGGQRA